MQENILRYFQENATPFWDKTAEAVTMLGEQYFFIIIISFVYWVISRRQGFKLAVIFVFSSVFNAVVKICFKAPRPFEKLSFVAGKRVETATGYSFPSGHTQGASSFFMTLALILKRWWAYLAAVVLMSAVAVTRVYLGVHWPLDVTAGLVFGVAIALALNRIIDGYSDAPEKIMTFFLILEGIVIVMTIALAIMDAAVLHGTWKIEDFFKISGISLGLVAGYFLEERYVRFNPTGGSVVQKGARYLLGLVLTVGLLLGLKAVFPENLFFDYLRYGMVGFWVAFLWPFLGIKLRLFAREETK